MIRHHRAPEPPPIFSTFHYGRDIIHPRYLAFVLHSQVGKKQFKSNEYGGTKQGLGLGDVKAVVIPLPPKEEQKAIVHIVDDAIAGITATITRIEREMALVREHRTRLIADIVTGQLDVREAVRHLPDNLNGLCRDFDPDDTGEDVELGPELTEAESDV